MAQFQQQVKEALASGGTVRVICSVFLFIFLISHLYSLVTALLVVIHNAAQKSNLSYRSEELMALSL